MNTHFFDKSFDSIGDYLKYILERQLIIEKDSLDGINGTIFYTNGDYSKFIHNPEFMSDSGTGWPEEFEIKHYGKL